MAKQAVRAAGAVAVEEDVLGLLASEADDFNEMKVQGDADEQAADTEVEAKVPDIVEVPNALSKKKKPTGAQRRKAKEQEPATAADAAASAAPNIGIRLFNCDLP